MFVEGQVSHNFLTCNTSLVAIKPSLNNINLINLVWNNIKDDHINATCIDPVIYHVLGNIHIYVCVYIHIYTYYYIHTYLPYNLLNNYVIF